MLNRSAQRLHRQDDDMPSRHRPVLQAGHGIPTRQRADRAGAVRTRLFQPMTSTNDTGGSDACYPSPPRATPAARLYFD